jgi:bleomycin hydrolase
MRYLRASVLVVLVLCLGVPGFGIADEEKEEKEEKKGFVFTPERTIRCTSVKNQAQTGTCWAFATNSFLEAELIRLGTGDHDLSEMFIVRHVYPRKALRFVRLHGNATLGPGSLANDALRVLREVGVVPEEVYDGKFAGQSRHNHGEMDAVVHGVLTAVVSNKGNTLSPAWPDALEGVLDAYLGKPPQEFTVGDQTFTPKSYAEHLGLDADDYVEFTSFTHHPFYTQFAVEIPDNWAGNLYWNVPLNELMRVMDRALEMGYTVAWDGDVSEESFRHKKGVATLPLKEWADRTKEEKEAIGDEPEPELQVTQEIRQRHFDNYASTDDHLMHVVGTARDQQGTRYYVMKNSWGTLDSEFEGRLHMSEAYVRSKTVSIMVHRDAVPEELAEKLKL